MAGITRKAEAGFDMPACPFYVADYLGSAKVMIMTLEQEGAYCRLLWYQWQDGSIPSDIASLARLCRVTPQVMRRVWTNVAPCFEPIEGKPGRLANLPMEVKRAEALAFRKRRAEAGAKGGKAKAELKPSSGNASDLPQANGEQAPSKSCPASSASSSASTEDRSLEEIADAREPDLFADVREADFIEAEKARKPAREWPLIGVPFDLARMFLAAWESAKGRTMGGEFRDGALALGRAWQKRGIDCGLFGAAVAAFLADEPKFTNGHDPRVMANKLDRYLDDTRPDDKPRLGRARVARDSGPCSNDVPSPCGHAHARHSKHPGGGLACADCPCTWYMASTAPVGTEATR